MLLNQNQVMHIQKSLCKEVKYCQVKLKLQINLTVFFVNVKVHKIAKSVDLTLSLEGSGLKFCKEDLNMAAINFSPLQNLKWLGIKCNRTPY